MGDTKDFDMVFISESENAFVLMLDGHSVKMGIPKKCCILLTDQVGDLTVGKVYQARVKKWFAKKYEFSEGGTNDNIKKKMKLIKHADSGKAVFVKLPEGYEVWIPVSWFNDPECIPEENEDENVSFTAEISAWKYKKKIEEAQEEENATGRQGSSDGKQVPSSGRNDEEFVEDDIPF
jgi:hypothetical protein